MLTTRPDRIPIEDRFPQRYAVNSLPTAAATKNQWQPSQARAKFRRQAKSNPKNASQANDPNSIEKYLTRPQLAVASGSGSREEGTPIDTPSSSTREEGELPSYWERPASAEKTDSIIAKHRRSGKPIPGSLIGW
jgi:hypothetical protein